MSKLYSKVSAAGLLVALGIIYGDIGTSPLYVFNAIVNGKPISDLLIIGGLSCVIWTLTLQTTVKYVMLTLQADNRGEGGIFSLYTLVRRRKRWLVQPAMIGGAALLADGMITPPVTITSAIEGLRQLPALSALQNDQQTIIYIVIGVIMVIFLLQQFGTASIGKMFGPIMLLWFSMLAFFGLIHISDDLNIFKAFNPYYAIKLLVAYPKGFWILGAVFLCTTGAEALYSDLGHCGKNNIRVSWVFVKISLIINYMGQGAWLLAHYRGQVFPTETSNPFYGLMPQEFLIFGVAIATAAAIIASQALISGSFTLISEAMRLNLWPKHRVKYPTEHRGQLFIAATNLLLFVGCVSMVLIFRKSTNMEAAYGLAITMCMIATTMLFANFLVLKRVARPLVLLFLITYLVIEGAFLAANLEKFPHGGFVTLIVGGGLFLIMYVWHRARKIKNRYVEFVRLENYIPLLRDLSTDKTVSKYATHLIYLTSANNPREIEHKIMFSILNRKPKRADIYWFIHVDTVDDPYTCEYEVDHIIPNEIVRIEFKLGFRMAPRIHLRVRKVMEDLVENGEVNITSRYESLERNQVMGDMHFVVLEKYLSAENELPFFERIVMNIHFALKSISLSEEKGFGLDSSYVKVEKFPLIVSPFTDLKMKRINFDYE